MSNIPYSKAKSLPTNNSQLMTKITVPATTANLGAGFDCIGAALSVYNHFTFNVPEESNQTHLTITVQGTEAQRVSTDASNLVYQSFQKFYQHLGKETPPVAINIELGVPLARGLGSSATAIIGGLMGANELAGKPLTQTEIMHLAIAIEGHPDNVVPAFLGNCQLSVANGSNWEICEIPWHQNLVPILAIPDFELSTEAARKVLPSQISYNDAVFNISHLGLLLRGLETNNRNWLQVAMEDKLHQPYRKTLIRGYDEVKDAAIDAGAYGMVISGAGPTLLALADTSQAETVATAMTQAWQTEGVTVQTLILNLDRQGACYS